MDLESKYLELQSYPLKLVRLGGKKAMVLYKNLRESQIIFTDFFNKETKFSDQTITSGMSQDQAGRHMDAAALNSPLESKYAPLLAILYDENKVDVFRGNEYLQRKQLVISQWSNQKSNSQGFLVLLPYSDFLVVAKQGETKIYFKNYIEINKNDRTLETALRSILHISLSPEHKIITVFDWELTALIQFNVPEISCGHDPLIVSCSSLLLNDQI